MCVKVEAFFAKVWAWVKSAFGHSKIVFVNAIGLLLSVYVEMQDYLISFQWDEFFKHEVALGIGFVTQAISILLRMYGNAAPISFTPKPPDAMVASEPIEEIPAPKAE